MVEGFIFPQQAFLFLSLCLREGMCLEVYRHPPYLYTFSGTLPFFRMRVRASIRWSACEFSDWTSNQKYHNKRKVHRRLRGSRNGLTRFYHCKGRSWSTMDRCRAILNFGINSTSKSLRLRHRYHILATSHSKAGSNWHLTFNQTLPLVRMNRLFCFLYFSVLGRDL